MSETILSSSVTLRRNACLPFKRIDASSVANKIGSVLNAPVTDGVGPLSKALSAKGLIPEPISSSARLIYDGSRYCVTVGGSDHFIICSSIKGNNLKEAYAVVKNLDDRIAECVKYAFHPTFGFETLSLSDVGTGMRVKLKLFTPALLISKTIGRYMRSLMAEGVLTEATETEDFTVYLSNKRTLGVTESEICESVLNAATYLEAAEKQMLQKLIESEAPEIKDKILRAYGTLTNCAILPENEFFEHVGYVRLGLHIGLLKCASTEAFEDFAVGVKGLELNRSSDASKEEAIALYARSLTEILTR